MKCDDYLEFISLYFDNSLDKNSEQQLFEHLDSCHECKKEFEEMKTMMDLLKNEPLAELPDGYHDQLMEKINQSKIIPLKNRNSKTSNWKKYSTIAASFLILFVVGGGIFGSGLLKNSGGGNSDSYSVVSPETMNISNDMALSEEKAVANATGGEPELMVAESAAEDSVASMDTGKVEQTMKTRTVDSAGIEDRKIIKNYYRTMEVKNLDEFSEQARSIAENSGGYVENFSSGIYYTDSSKNIKLKEGNITIKVPKEACESVLESMADLGTIISEDENSRDITSEYVDTDGRLKAKRLEETRLLEILEKCETVEDILKVEEQLGRIRADIEAYTTTLNNWDKLVDFSSITIYAQEVGNTSIDSLPDDFGSKIKDSFIQSVNLCIEGLQNIVLFGARLSVPIAVIAVVLIIIAVMFKVNKKKKSKKEVEE